MELRVKNRRAAGGDKYGLFQRCESVARNGNPLLADWNRGELELAVRIGLAGLLIFGGEGLDGDVRISNGPVIRVVCDAADSAKDRRTQWGGQENAKDQQTYASGL